MGEKEGIKKDIEAVRADMHETEELQTLQLLIRMNEKVSLERLAVLESNKIK